MSSFSDPFQTDMDLQILKILPLKQQLSQIFSFLYGVTKIKDMDNLSTLFTFPYSNQLIFYQEILSFIDISRENNLYTRDYKGKLSKLRSQDNIINKFAEINQKLDLLDKLLSIDITTYLPDDLLVKNDIASMTHSMEVRSPLLDHEFMQLTAQMPPAFKLKNLQTKYIFKKIAKKFLPQEVIDKRKQPFLPPLDRWFREEYYEYIKSQLLDKQLLKLNIFKKDMLDKLIEDHYLFKENNAYLIWRLLCLREWLKIWFNL